MLPTAAVVALALASGGPALDLGPEPPPLAEAGAGGLLGALSPSGEGLEAPSCAADVCQPRVAIPGFAPTFSTSGRRTALALSLLRRTRIEPLSSVAGLLAAAGLRFDYRLASAGTDSSERGRSPQFQVFLRWRLDALNRPVWLDHGPRG